MLVLNIFFLIIVGLTIAAPVARLRDEARLVTAGAPLAPSKGMTGKVPAVAVTTNPQQEQEPNIPEAPEALEGPEAPGTLDAPYTIDPLPYHNPTPEAANYPDAANHPDAASHPETANNPEVASYPGPHDFVVSPRLKRRRILPLAPRSDPKQHAANVEKIDNRKAFHASRVEKWNRTWGHYPVTRQKGQPVQPGTPGTGGGHHVKSCPANKDYSKCVTH